MPGTEATGNPEERRGGPHVLAARPGHQPPMERAMTYCHTCKTGLVEPGDGIEVDEETGEPLYAVEPLPEPEVYAMPVEMTDPRVSQGVRNVIKPGLAAGWRIVGLAYARGPRVGS